MARSASSAWMEHLPLVLLGIWTSVRQDSFWSPSELVYVATLRLPGEFFPGPSPPVQTSEFVTQLQTSLRDMTPFPADFHGDNKQASVPKSLFSCPAVFVRVDAVKKPLVQPYVGPYEVLKRGEKTFVLLKLGKPWTVSVDRLKPFFSPVMSAPQKCSSSSDSSLLATPPAAPAVVPPPAAPSVPVPPQLAPVDALRTRYGRKIRNPDRYNA